RPDVRRSHAARGSSPTRRCGAGCWTRCMAPSGHTEPTSWGPWSRRSPVPMATWSSCSGPVPRARPRRPAPVRRPRPSTSTVWWPTPRRRGPAADVAVVALVVHHERPEAAETARRAAAWLTERGHEVRCPAADAAIVGLEAHAVADEAIAVGLDLAASLGGDGTILRTVDMVSTE